MTQVHAAQNTRSRGGMIGRQGRRRQLEIARETEAERKALEAGVIAALGRLATAIGLTASVWTPVQLDGIVASERLQS